MGQKPFYGTVYVYIKFYCAFSCYLFLKITKQNTFSFIIHFTNL